MPFWWVSLVFVCASTPPTTTCRATRPWKSSKNLSQTCSHVAGWGCLPPHSHVQCLQTFTNSGQSEKLVHKNKSWDFPKLCPLHTGVGLSENLSFSPQGLKRKKKKEIWTSKEVCQVKQICHRKVGGETWALLTGVFLSQLATLARARWYRWKTNCSGTEQWLKVLPPECSEWAKLVGCLFSCGAGWSCFTLHSLKSRSKMCVFVFVQSACFEMSVCVLFGTVSLDQVENRCFVEFSGCTFWKVLSNVLGI